MATGTFSDFKIYEPEFQAGVFESVARNVNAFNGASRQAIRLVQRSLSGHYAKEAFFQRVSNLITRRDISAVTSPTALKLSQAEQIAVKLNRKVGPIEHTFDSFRKAGLDAREFSYQLGLVIGEEKTREMLDAGLIAGAAAIGGESSLTYDATGETTATMTHMHLVSGLAKMGDAAGRIVAWVMHSKVAFDLMRQSITDNVVNVADLAIIQGTVATLGRPVIVTDSPALVTDNDPDPDTYATLGLVADGIVLTESEEETILMSDVTGQENLIKRVQGEYAFNVGVRGFAYDTATAGTNPTNTTLADDGSWDLTVATAKAAAGVQIITE